MEALNLDWSSGQYYKPIEQFEAAFANRVGRKYALMTPNCTIAIELALRARGIKKDNLVAVPNNTWIGSTAGIHTVGASQVVCDVGQRSWCLEVTNLIEADYRLNAVVVVDLFGQMPDYNSLLNYTEKHGIFVIEDAAEALGSTYNGKPAGSFGDVSVFSFHRSKTIACGEGGMVVTDNDKLYEMMWTLRDQGRPKSCETYKNEYLAHKFIPSNMQAALGLSQLMRLDSILEHKRRVFRWYHKHINMDDKSLTPDIPGVSNSYWVPILVFKDNTINTDFVINTLAKNGIYTRRCFYQLSELPAYSRIGFFRNNTPNCKWLQDHAINLPSPMDLTEEDVERIAGVINIL